MSVSSNALVLFEMPCSEKMMCSGNVIRKEVVFSKFVDAKLKGVSVVELAVSS